MFCPRLNHFVRLNRDGTIGKCGHMVNAKGFTSYQKLNNSQWLNDIRKKMDTDKWPDECIRCQQTENINGESIRTKSIERHKALHPLRDDYLIVGGVLDNVCNSACQTCHSGLSTKIGSLESKNYTKLSNFDQFYNIPQDQILEVDVNGGEPTASKHYKKLLANLPHNTKIVRMNTNGSRMIKELETILKQRIMVIVTLSLDGVENVHDYVRWPIKWKKYISNVANYQNLQKQFPNLKLNTWTTVSALNILDLPRIFDYVLENNLEHDWALLNSPTVLDVKYKNIFTETAKNKLSKSTYAECKKLAKRISIDSDNTEQLRSFIQKQDYLRKIDIKDYFNLFPK